MKNRIGRVRKLFFGVMFLFVAGIKPAEVISDNAEIQELTDRIKNTVASAKARIEPKKEEGRKIIEELKKVQERIKTSPNEEETMQLRLERDRLKGLLIENSSSCLSISLRSIQEINTDMTRLSELVNKKSKDYETESEKFALGTRKQIGLLNTLAKDVANDRIIQGELIDVINGIVMSVNSDMHIKRNTCFDYTALMKEFDLSIISGREIEEKLKDTLAR